MSLMLRKAVIGPVKAGMAPLRALHPFIRDRSYDKALRTHGTGATRVVAPHPM